MKKLLLTVLFPIISFSQNFDEVIIAGANNWIQPKIIDLDNDGLDDLVSVSRDGNVVWWKKDNTFSFTKTIIDETSKSWNQFNVFDIDGDLDLDILVSEQNSVEIYYNDGNQNFTATYINANSLSSNIIAGDFDGDGYYDFITTSRGQNGPVKLWKNFMNIGFPNFNQVTIANVQISSGDILSNDIDNDGDLDLIMSVSSGFWTGNHVLCYLNDGSGNFTEHVINYTLSNEHIQILDYDNDGDKDFAVKQGNCCTVLFINDGSLGFTDTQLTNDADLKSIHIVDFDNDGNNDISVVFSSSNSNDFFGFYINDGSGNFTLNTLENLNEGERINSLDYNNDGLIDFVVTSSAFDDPRIYENQGGGSFNTFALDDSFVSPTSFHSSDIDNDGLIDLVSTSSDEHELVLWHNAGTFNFTKIVLDNTESLIKYAHIDDINGDGQNDILVATYGFNLGEILLYTNDGNLNFTKSVFLSVTNVKRAFTTDINNDGNTDIIITRPASGNGQMYYYLGDGIGNYQSSLFINTIGDNKLCIDYLDVNNDGFGDLITDGAFYYQNDGNLNFTEIPLLGEGAFFDMDGDNDLDFLSSRYDFSISMNIIAWHENDGSGSFTEHQIQTGTTNSGDKFTIQDFDGDGDIDFVSCPTNDFNSQKLSYWINDGNQTFIREEINPYYLTSTHLISNDFDGDGDIDVLSSNTKFPFTLWKNTSDVALSISETPANLSLLLYPNPTTNYINIKTNDAILKAELYNIQGQKVNASFSNNKVDIQNISNGIYFLKLKTDKGTITKKIIKE